MIPIVLDRKKAPRRGLPVVVSAPSGAGKSTIVSRVLKVIPNAVPSISCTTRAPRGREKSGRDYFFLSPAEFKSRLRKGEFLEWARVHGHLYGTLKSRVMDQLRRGHDVFLTIDVQGGKSLRKHFPKGVYIFVVPPSWGVLVKRLKKRGLDGAESIALRLRNARRELSYLPLYDFVVVNDNLKKAVAQVKAIVAAAHCRAK